MGVQTVSAACCCGSIGRTDLRQCKEHFHLWNGDVRLTSVGRIIKTCWPQGPLPPADVLENARARGEETDRLFSAYVVGKLDCIPAGTRTDSRDLLLKLIHWFERQNFRHVESQIVIGDSEVGGVLDLRLDGMILDLKATYNVEQQHILQVAGYASLDAGCDDYGLLHVTERFSEPRLIHYGGAEVDDWELMRTHWAMLKRRGAIQ